MNGLVNAELAVVALVFGPVAAFLLTWFWIRHAGAWHWIASPNHRSSHHTVTPTGGGVGFVLAGATVSSLLGWAAGEPSWLHIAVPASLLGVVGFIDDRWGVSWKLRLFIQLLAVFGVIQVVYPGDDLINDWTGWVFVLGLTLTGIWWINLFNFMDGIDGLAASQGIFMVGASCWLAAHVGGADPLDPIWLGAVGVGIAVTPFLVLNWAPARVFMGDVGSTWLALMIMAWALLSWTKGWLDGPVWAILACVFVSDASLTLARRLVRGRHALEAHRSHAYQRLSRSRVWRDQRAHAQVSLLVLAVNMLWLMPLAYAAARWPHFGAWWFVLAYLPVTGAVLALGAGCDDHDR